jgi:hypothetical protein
LGRRPLVVANAIGHIDDRAGGFVRDDTHCASRRGGARVCPPTRDRDLVVIHASRVALRRLTIATFPVVSEIAQYSAKNDLAARMT